MQRPTTICALTENRPGVLARIAGLFSRRGFNLLSVTAEQASDPDLYCITLVVEESDAGDMVISIDVVHTLDGYEKIDGTDCARIASALTGTVEGTGAQQGVEWVTEGEIEGAGTWYFDYKKGRLVRDVTQITGTGTTTAAGEEGDLTIPLSWTIMVTNMLAP